MYRYKLTFWASISLGYPQGDQWMFLNICNEYLEIKDQRFTEYINGDV